LVGAGLLVDVRVRLLGQLAEGALDLRVRGVPPDAEDRVEVAFRGHPAESLPAGPRAGAGSRADGRDRRKRLDSNDPEDTARWTARSESPRSRRPSNGFHPRATAARSASCTS